MQLKHAENKQRPQNCNCAYLEKCFRSIAKLKYLSFVAQSRKSQTTFFAWPTCNSRQSKTTWQILFLPPPRLDYFSNSGLRVAFFRCNNFWAMINLKLQNSLDWSLRTRMKSFQQFANVRDMCRLNVACEQAIWNLCRPNLSLGNVPQKPLCFPSLYFTHITCLCLLQKKSFALASLLLMSDKKRWTLRTFQSLQIICCFLGPSLQAIKRHYAVKTSMNRQFWWIIVVLGLFVPFVFHVLLLYQHGTTFKTKPTRSLKVLSSSLWKTLLLSRLEINRSTLQKIENFNGLVPRGLFCRFLPRVTIEFLLMILTVSKSEFTRPKLAYKVLVLHVLVSIKHILERKNVQALPEIQRPQLWLSWGKPPSEVVVLYQYCDRCLWHFAP